MKYDLKQRTLYDYGAGVALSQHVLRLLPVDRPGQVVEAASLRIAPPPGEQADSRDFFGNAVHAIGFDAPHDRLDVVTTARVEVTRADPPIADLTPAWEVVRASAAASADLGPMSPVHGLYPSRAVPLVPAITDYAATSFPPGRPVLAGAVELARRIKADFTYEPGATDVSTPPAEAFSLRRGVCQDFAHIVIAGLRGLGLPVLYVSGYLRTLPPPGRQRLEGADATHAWVSVWCGPEVGWIGIDPTNAIPAGTDHVELAIGRDYVDVAPMQGVILAAGAHRLTVAVDVVPVAGAA